MARAPKPIPIERHFKPESGRVAWTAAPPRSVFTGGIKAEEKARAKRELEATIARDGYDPASVEFFWMLLDGGFGWAARVRKPRSA